MTLLLLKMLTFLRVAVLSDEEVNLLKRDSNFHWSDEASLQEDYNEFAVAKESEVNLLAKRALVPLSMRPVYTYTFICYVMLCNNTIKKLYFQSYIYFIGPIFFTPRSALQCCLVSSTGSLVTIRKYERCEY